MTLTRRAAVFGIALAGLPLPALAGGRARFSGRAFGTSWSVIAHGLHDPRETANRIGAALARIDAEMSPFHPYSALSRFNAGATGVTVSADFEHVARTALAIAQESGGAFDPGIGPAVHRYGFGPIRGGFQPGGWQQIRCENRRLSAAGAVTLDLCGIAKGFAVDVVAAILHDQTADFIVEIGGEIRCGGDWPVGIADPLSGGVHSRIRLASGAVATSGDAVNGFDHGGRRWSHTMDPATGQPVSNGIASVSVLAPTAMEADALATALLVMGAERGLALADRRRAGALFLIREGGGLAIRQNAAFAAQLI